MVTGLGRHINYALQIQALSFTLDDEEEDEDRSCSTDDSDAEKCELPVKKKIRKNPDVDTSFLPDREREDEENKLREELRQVRNLFPNVSRLQPVNSIIIWAVLLSKPKTLLHNRSAELNMHGQIAVYFKVRALLTLILLMF